jgi:hypothetical protein
MSLAGPADFHQHATAQDFHTCPIHHWIHGAGTGAPAAINLVAFLPLAGCAIPELQKIAPNLWHHSTSSRAPPAIA